MNLILILLSYVFKSVKYFSSKIFQNQETVIICLELLVQN